MTNETELFSLVADEIERDTLVLPGMPDIAVRVQEAVADPLMTLPRLSKIISQDPALTGRLIKIANSAWLGRAVKTENLPQALTRLGFWQIRNVALGVALESLFKAQNILVQKELHRNWRESLELTAAAVTLLNHYKGERNLHTHTLALACMTSRIGMLPILSMAERQPSVFGESKFLRKAEKSLASSLGGKVLRSWNFTSDLVEVQENWRLGIASFEPGYLSFMQLAGVLLGQIKVARPDEVVKMFADTGAISRARLWQQPGVQADYQDILGALTD